MHLSPAYTSLVDAAICPLKTAIALYFTVHKGALVNGPIGSPLVSVSRQFVLNPKSSDLLFGTDKFAQSIGYIITEKAFETSILVRITSPRWGRSCELCRTSGPQPRS